MSSNLDVLATCLGISGSFEGGNGGPRWDLVTGNFDGQGISMGALQWNIGTGSIQPILAYAKDHLGDDTSRFSDILALQGMDRRKGLAFAKSTWINPTSPKGSLLPAASALWSAFAGHPAVVEAQRQATQIVLTHASKEAVEFLPEDMETTIRAMAFFFDLRTQQGGMTKKMDDGRLLTPDVIDSPDEATSASAAIAFARSQGMSKSANAWEEAIAQDPMAKILLHYAYERAMLSRQEYRWDTLSRRGTIACLSGGVHGKWFDLHGKIS